MTASDARGNLARAVGLRSEESEGIESVGGDTTGAAVAGVVACSFCVGTSGAAAPVATGTVSDLAGCKSGIAVGIDDIGSLGDDVGSISCGA